MKTKYELLVQYEFASKVKDEESARKAFPDLESLVRFAYDVDHLSFPESYAQSPWDFAYSIASDARGSRITNSYCLDSESHRIAMAYRQEAGLNITRESDGHLFPIVEKPA